MNPLAVLLVIALVVIGLIIICNATRNNEGLTLGSGATLVITTSLQDASRLIDQAIHASNSADATSLLRQSSEKLQATIESITKAEQEFGSQYTVLKSQAISAKTQLDDIIKQFNAAKDANTLQTLQRGVLTSYQSIIGMLYEKLITPTTTVVTTPVTYVQPAPTYYIRPIYIPWPRPPFPGPHPGPWPGPHPGPWPHPPGGSGSMNPPNPPGTTPAGFAYHY